MAAGKPPRGARAVRCYHCGLPAWQGRLHPDTARKTGWKTPTTLLEPRHYDSGSVQLAIDGSGLIVISRQFGEYDVHRCPAKTSRCKHCQLPVLVLHQPPDAAVRLAVLDPDPDERGTVAIDRKGYAVFPAGDLPGPRYRWHKHAGERQDSGGLVADLMREVPRGR